MNANLKEALDNCNSKYFEFNLKFDDDYDDIEDREKNLKSRGNAADKLVKFLEKQNFDEIDLSFVHEKEFEITWSSIMYEIFRFIISPISVVVDLASCVVTKTDFCTNLEQAVKYACYHGFQISGQDTDFCEKVLKFKTEL